MRLIKFYKSGYLLQHCNYNFGLSFCLISGHKVVTWW